MCVDSFVFKLVQIVRELFEIFFELENSVFAVLLLAPHVELKLTGILFLEHAVHLVTVNACLLNFLGNFFE